MTLLFTSSVFTVVNCLLLSLGKFLFSLHKYGSRRTKTSNVSYYPYILQALKEEVKESTDNSATKLKDVHKILVFGVFNEEDTKAVTDRRNDLKEQNLELAKKEDEKFDK